MWNEFAINLQFKGSTTYFSNVNQTKPEFKMSFPLELTLINTAANQISIYIELDVIFGCFWYKYIQVYVYSSVRLSKPLSFTLYHICLILF